MKQTNTPPAAADALKPLEDLMKKVKAAQAVYATFGQRVRHLFCAEQVGRTVSVSRHAPASHEDAHGQ